MKKYPKRITSIEKSTGQHYTRNCPQNEWYKEQKNNEIVGELFKTNKDFAYPYCIIYKETLPMMRDGYMTWYFESLAQIKKAKWKKLKKDK